MKKIVILVAVMVMLSTSVLAVRYGVKKQIYTGASMSYPSYLCYSPASNRMFSLHGGVFNVLSMDCAGDSSLGPLAGTVYAAPMVYDAVNDRIYSKDTDFFTAIDCAANMVDTNFMLSNGAAGVEYNQDNNKIYVYDGMSPDAFVFDPATYTSSGTITNISGLMHYFSPNNSLYTPHATSDSLMVYSGATNARTGSIYIPGLISASNEKISSNPTINRLYLSLPNLDQLAIVNTASNTLVTTLAVGDNPSDFALCPVNNRMFFTCNGSSQYSLQYLDSMDVLDSVAVGDSVSALVYNPSDSLIYIGCWRGGYVKIVDPRLPVPLVVDSVFTQIYPHAMDMAVDNGGDVYCAMYNSDNIYVIGKIPQRMWRTMVSGGQWFDYMFWEYSDDGGTVWQTPAMMETPNCATDSTVLIQSGHSMSISSPVVLDQLVINGLLDQNSMVTINDGPGDDVLINNGVYQRQMGPLTVNPGATLVFGPGSQYTHNMDGDTIPAASWDSLSQVSITGVMSITPAGLDQAFGNIIWDCFQQAGDHVLPGGASFSARNLSVYSTGTGSLFLTSAAKTELAVDNLYISSANAVLGSGGNRKLHIKGNLEIFDPGWLYLTDTLNPGIDSLFLYGNYLHTMAGIAGGGPDSTAIVFCGSDTQSYVGPSEILTGYINYLVRPGAHLMIPEGNMVGFGSLGDFTLMPGATLSYSDYQGIYSSGQDAGVIRNLGARNYSQGANYRLYGISTGPYVTGPGIPDTVNQLIVESSMDQAYISKDLVVMDTLKLLGNNLRIDGLKLSLFGPILQTLGNLIGDGASQLAIMGGNTTPLSLPSQFRDVGTLIINRPTTVSLTDTMLIYNRLELVNGTLDNGGNKLTFQDGSVIFRSGNGSLTGVGSVVFVNQVGLEYGGGIVTAGAEMPPSNLAIMFLAVKGATDTLIVNRDTLNVWNNLSLSGGLKFNGKSFASYGLIDTVGAAGEVILTDSCRANIFGVGAPIYLPGISGGTLTIDNSSGTSMRRDINCTGPLTLSTGGLTVGPNTLILGDSLTGTGVLSTDSTSALVFKGNAVSQTMPSTVNQLGYLAWDRPATLIISSPLVLHDSLKLGQGSVDNSANLTLRAGVTIVRNSGTLAMAPLFEGGVDVIYGSHGGGTIFAGNELPANVTDLENLTLSLGMMSNDTISLAGAAQVNGRLRLEQGVLSVGANTLTLRDTIEMLMGQMAADSTSNLWVLGCPYAFSLPANVDRLGGFYLESTAGASVTDSLRIDIVYRQIQGHLLGGKLYYGPAGTLAYWSLGVDTTSDREFPLVSGPRDLWVNTAGTLYLHDSRVVPGELVLGSPLNTGANTITIDTFGVIGGGSFVEGKIARLFPLAVDTIIAFPLGTAPGGPSPVEVRAFNNTVPAFVTAGIRATGHPLVNDSTACLKKHWTFSGAGLGADACQITLHYLPGDFNPPGFEEALHESTMVAGRYDATLFSWQIPNILARNSFGPSDGGSIVLAQAGNFNTLPEFTLGRDSAAIVSLAGDLTPPFIVTAQPAAGATGVALNAAVSITFSEPINPASFAYSINPNPGGLAVVWSADSTVASISHLDFLPDSVYMLDVFGAADTAGNPLATGPVPNPWSFTTASASDTVGPYLSFTQPFNGQTGVRLKDPVMLSFNEAVDSLSLRFTCTPDPGGWTQNWDVGSQWVYLNHNPFAPGVTYNFKLDSLLDTAGNQLRSDTLGAPNPWSFTIVPNDTVSYAWSGGAYRLISVPVVPGDTTAVGNFGDDLGAYSDATWRIFGYKPGTGYVERPGIKNGYGYWMASFDNANLDIIGTAPDQFVTVPVDSGWNIIGMPFDTVLDLRKITVIWNDTVPHYLPYDNPLVDAVFSQRLWSWNDPTNDMVNDNGQWDSLTPYSPFDSLRPWQGYAGYAVRPCTLQISPIGMKGGQPYKAPCHEILWQVSLEVNSGNSWDRGIKLGVSPQARPKYDRLDAEKPPLIASTVRAYIPHDDWNRGPCREYQQDFRSNSDYIEWPLKVDLTDQNRPASLNYSLSGNLEPGYSLYLIDRRNLRTVTINGNGTLGFNGSQELALVYSNQGPGPYSLRPLSLELGQPRPNPFDRQAALSYQLPQQGRVTLKIYNISGQLVRILVDGESPPGYYIVRWDGRDHNGLTVSSGIYMARLSTGGRELVQKLVKVR